MPINHDQPPPISSPVKGLSIPEKDHYVKPYKRQTHKTLRPRHSTSSRRKPAFMAPAVNTRGRQPAWELTTDATYPGDESHGELDDSMDSMSVQLQNLINEGRKALGREIVVSVDGQCRPDEDIEDDGDQGWGDEDFGAGPSVPHQGGLRSSRRSRRGSPSQDGHRSHSRPSTPNLYRTNSRPSSRRGTISRQSSLPQDCDPSFPSASSYGTSMDAGVDLRAAMNKVRKVYGLEP